MRKLKIVAIGCALAALLAPTSALAHNGKHWTETQAEKKVINVGIRDDSGERHYPYDALCRGYGHHFIAFNGNHVYSKFTCALYFSDGCFMIDLWVKKGFNWVWLEERSVNYC
jgi:hypothetical protein